MIQYPRVTTKLVILLGNPLGHSVSPPMHNRVFEKLRMDYCYMPVEVTSKNLKKVFSGLSEMNVAGFNVTIPHKINIIQYLDELDSLAATIGAVNTICVKDGKTKGYNTDGEGFILSLEETAQTKVKGKRVFLLGSGGAARAIAMTLAFHHAEKIYIHNRTTAKAEKLADEINRNIRVCAVVVESMENQRKAIQTCDILTNSTSLGMHPDEDVLPIDESLLTPDVIVADIVYNPLMTKLLKTAKDKGCTIVPGLGMLIYQGAAAFKLFTGVEPLVEEMSEVVHSLMASK
ncbi:MAG: shikimate dehydrogenase [Desulfobacterales bacterium]|nr:shikimate dehydrogenase [Desulfobacterales bacterium]